MRRICRIPRPIKVSQFDWDESLGRITSLRAANGIELIDDAAAHGMGQVVVETLKDRGQRPVLAARNWELLAKQFRDEPVRLLSAAHEAAHYANSLITAWEHPILHRVEQRWDVMKSIGRAMLTTTIWTREIADPCAIYLAFPLAVPDAEIVYDSVGCETVFGRENSMPGTCARGSFATIPG